MFFLYAFLRNFGRKLETELQNFGCQEKQQKTMIEDKIPYSQNTTGTRYQRSELLQYPKCRSDLERGGILTKADLRKE